MRKVWVGLCVSVAVFANYGISSAAADEGVQSGDSQLRLQLKIDEGCSSKFDKEISFSPFIALKEPKTENGSFSLLCTKGYGGDKGGIVKVSLDGGIKNNPDEAGRRALYPGSDVTKPMYFQVYKGSFGKDVWGTGNGDGGEPYEVTISADTVQEEHIPFHVELLAQDLRDYPQGEYSQTLRATVEYTK